MWMYHGGKRKATIAVAKNSQRMYWSGHEFICSEVTDGFTQTTISTNGGSGFSKGLWTLIQIAAPLGLGCLEQENALKFYSDYMLQSDHSRMTSKRPLKWERIGSTSEIESCFDRIIIFRDLASDCYLDSVKILLNKALRKFKLSLREL